MKENISCSRSKVDNNLIEDAKQKIINSKSSINLSSKYFALLGSEVRLSIIYLLLQYKQLCVCDLSDILNINQSPISQHLRKLKDANLVKNERDGMTIYYHIEESIKPLLKTFLKQI